MFWPFLIISAIGIGLVKLSATSVQAAVLSSALKLTFLIIAILAGLLLLVKRKIK